MITKFHHQNPKKFLVHMQKSQISVNIGLFESIRKQNTKHSRHRKKNIWKPVLLKQETHTESSFL